MLLTLGCAKNENSPPRFFPIGDQQGAVGSELSIALRASDVDGDTITFSYSLASKDNDIAKRARLYSGGGGTAIWRWVPIGADVGEHIIEFVASDGQDVTRRRVKVVIKSAAGGAGSPIFR